MRHLQLLVVLCVLWWASPASATTYYVRTDGNNGNAGTANTAGGAWLTIDYAADTVSPGDTVRVQAGTYAATVSPGVSGTNGNVITFVADGTVTTCAWTISGRSYLRVIGFTVDTDTGVCSMVNGAVTFTGANTYIELWHNTLTNAVENGVRCGTGCTLSNSLIIGNTVSSMGIGNYSGSGMSFQGSHNIIAANTITNVDPDGFVAMGTYNRFLNNYLYAMREDGAGHPDVFQVGSSASGWSYNLYESTLQLGIGDASEEHSTQFSNAQSCGGTCPDFTNNILRRNIWHNVSTGTVGINQATSGDITHTRYYHNTTADACVTAGSATTRYGIAWYGTGVSDGFIHNNIEYESWGDSATSSLEVYYVEGGLTLDYNLAYDPDGSVTFASVWTNQAHEQSNVNPQFVNFAGDNFALNVASGAIGAGGPLTTTSGGGTGTTFSVATNGGYFFVADDSDDIPQYGGVLAPGDTLLVNSDQVTVVSISGDSITVSETFTWANGESVYWGTDSTPDIGALPYKAGGYGLSITHQQVGSTVTITPNDADLVRWVTCYEDAVPVTVDATSPFTCTVGTGVLAVRAFARYASSSPVVQVSGAPSAPTSVAVPSSGTPTLNWTHNGANVTHFTCQIDAGPDVSLGLPTPASTTYAASLSACGTLTTGAHTLTIQSCNGTSCTDAAPLIVVKL